MDCLRKGQLSERILYIATTMGVPLKIAGKPGKETDAASVDSELATLYGAIRGVTVRRDGPMPNPFYRQRNAVFSHKRFPMYLVMRLAAYDVPMVKRMIDLWMEAHNRGKVVLDMKSPAHDHGWLPRIHQAR